jgi:DNA-binding transcriptional LysR family regulator
LGVERMVICASPAYLAQHGSPITVADFASHTGIAYVHLGVAMPWQICDDQGVMQGVSLRRSIQMDDMQSIIDAASAGVGLALVPGWRIVSQVAAGQLVQLTDPAQSTTSDIHVVWPQTRYLASKMRVAIDTLVAEVPLLANAQKAV